MAFVKEHRCKCCGHRARVISNCGQEHCEIQKKIHRHCDEGCVCTAGGCMTEPIYFGEG